ncbi:MAG TPA: hypothetical protein VGO58_05065 [Chitinophagaceae bacterium]|jgi:hypothetical protein|nr:hypothetical protein [Chitinophagaceae bacterium]
MKKLLVMLLSLISVSAFSQTVEDVILKYSTAMGGLDAFNKVNTAKLTGVLTTQGIELPLTTQVVNGKAMRTDVTVNGQAIVNVYDNGTGWKINPYGGAPTPTDVTGTELISFKAQANLANNLMDYKNRGHKVELLEQEDVEGVKAYKIKLTTKDEGKVTTYFISTTDNMLLKSVTKREIAGNEYDAESFYSGFKTVNGLKFCFQFVQKIEGKPFQDVKYSSIELNVAVDESIFVKPK